MSNETNRRPRFVLILAPVILALLLGFISRPTEAAAEDSQARWKALMQFIALQKDGKVDQAYQMFSKKTKSQFSLDSYKERLQTPSVEHFAREEMKLTKEDEIRAAKALYLAVYDNMKYTPYDVGQDDKGPTYRISIRIDGPDLNLFVVKFTSGDPETRKTFSRLLNKNDTDEQLAKKAGELAKSMPRTKATVTYPLVYEDGQWVVDVDYH